MNSKNRRLADKGSANLFSRPPDSRENGRSRNTFKSASSQELRRSRARSQPVKCLVRSIARIANNDRPVSEGGEKCELTGKLVVPGILERCEMSGKRVLPCELEKSVATGKRALKQFFVSSSISGARLLGDEGIILAAGKYCLEREAKVCAWSSRQCHPDDLRTCHLTRVAAHFEYMTSHGENRLEPLLNLLNGLQRKS